MQTASYTVNSGSGVALWRGIPAQITISGIESTSGNWLFLVDNDFSDGVILSGTVAASGENLVVTLAEMNTVEIAAVVQGRDTLQCRATLTDSVSRVYLIPVTIRNRAVDGTPTPVAEYYTKAQIDAMIAAIPAGARDYAELTNKPAINSVTLAGNMTAAALGLATPEQIPPAQVQSNWNETDTASKAYIQNKPVIPSVPVQSVNGKTGAVELSASDVGALPTSGGELTATLSFDLTANSVTAIAVTSNGSDRVTIRNGHLLVGLNNSASAYTGALAVGQNCNAAAGYGCLAIGKNVTNGQTSSLGVGEYISVSAIGQAVFGQYNASDADAVLVLGNGTSTSARSNAFVVKKTGAVEMAGDLTFTPSGGTATTLSALIARIEALEAR